MVPSNMSGILAILAGSHRFGQWFLLLPESRHNRKPSGKWRVKIAKNHASKWTPVDCRATGPLECGDNITYGSILVRLIPNSFCLWKKAHSNKCLLPRKTSPSIQPLVNWITCSCIGTIFWWIWMENYWLPMGSSVRVMPLDTHRSKLSRVLKK